MDLIIDIESVPGQAPGLRDEFIAAVQAPAAYKKPESIAEWLAANREAEGDAAWQKTSFDGGLGQIVCIGWATAGGGAQSLHVADLSLQQERALLADWFALLRTLHGTSGTRPVVIGHNVAAFDLPFIWKRAIVHGLRPPHWLPRNPKPWSESVFDTMTEWAGTKDRISMDKLCRILGIPGKGDGPTGADVWPMAQRGEFAAIAQYCQADVERTRAIWQRLTFVEV